MKKLMIFLFVCFLAKSFSQTNISPQFSELKGMEDQQGNTHLFYRIYSSYSNDPFYDTNNDIYHFDLATLADTLFLSDYSHSDPVMSYFRSVEDYDFWNQDFSKYIFCGSMGSWEPGPYIKRFDSDYTMLNYLCCEINQIDISNNDDSLLYSGGYLYGESQANSIRSHDGGLTWTPVIDTLMYLSLNPFNDNLMFFENLSGSIYRSIDGANSFHLVDVMSESGFSDSFLYDSDELHMCRIYSEKTLRTSPNKGEAFSWETKYSSDSEIFISIDESISGIIYLADKKNIFVSTNFGNDFDPIKTLESNIVGLYRKHNSDFLYAATQYRIYEIDLWEDSLKIIKSITPSSVNYNWFPLKVGNLWAYENYYTENGIPYFAGYSWKWIDEKSVLQNGFEYFRMIERLTNGDKDTVFLRLDSLTAIIYAHKDETGQDLLFEDLSAELGDSVCYEYNFFWGCPYVQSEIQFSIWGLNTMKKELYPNYSGWVCDHSLVKGIGLYHQGCGDLTTFYSNLIGCVVDGITYGDTTTVGVEDEENLIATEFKLEQNYPNPFNPSTKIKFSIPSVETRDRVSVLLKVYDVLGNEIATLVNEEKPVGEYEVEFSPESSIKQPTSGIYFYQLKAGSFIQTKKMVYLK